MERLLSLIMIGFAGVVLIANSSLFIIEEGQEALVVQLGAVKKKDDVPKVYKPGLHFKLPFVSTVKKFDVRLQDLDSFQQGGESRSDAYEVMTGGKKPVLISYFVKWRINDLANYYVKTKGQVSRARNLLNKRLKASLADELSAQTIEKVVSVQRGAVMDALEKNARETAKDLGIEIVDVGLREISLPKPATESVYSNMREGRYEEATKIREEGYANAKEIRETALANAEISIAEAKEEAAKERAAGDAKAANVYATAYRKDPDFAAFYQSMKAYEAVLSKKDNVMVLQPKSEFFQYFNQVNK